MTAVAKADAYPEPYVAGESPVPVQVPERAQPAERTKPAAKLTNVTIICNQSRFEELKSAMNGIGVTGMTVTQVLGCGIQKGKTEYYRGVPMTMNLLPKVQVEIVVSKVPVAQVVYSAMTWMMLSRSVAASMDMTPSRAWNKAQPPGLVKSGGLWYIGRNHHREEWAWSRPIKSSPQKSRPKGRAIWSSSTAGPENWTNCCAGAARSC